MSLSYVTLLVAFLSPLLVNFRCSLSCRPRPLPLLPPPSCVRSPSVSPSVSPSRPSLGFTSPGLEAGVHEISAERILFGNWICGVLDETKTKVKVVGGVKQVAGSKYKEESPSCVPPTPVPSWECSTLISAGCGPALFWASNSNLLMSLIQTYHLMPFITDVCASPKALKDGNNISVVTELPQDVSPASAAGPAPRALPEWTNEQALFTLPGVLALLPSTTEARLYAPPHLYNCPGFTTLEIPLSSQITPFLISVTEFARVGPSGWVSPKHLHPLPCGHNPCRLLSPNVCHSRQAGFPDSRFFLLKFMYTPILDSCTQTWIFWYSSPMDCTLT